MSKNPSLAPHGSPILLPVPSPEPEPTATSGGDQRSNAAPSGTSASGALAGRAREAERSPAGARSSADPAGLSLHEALATIRAHYASGGGVYLGRRAEGWVWSGEEHATLVLGPPRSGKTTAVVVPSIVAARGSVLSTSTKPDIARATLGLRRQLGPCLLYDPTGSVGPLPGVEPVRWSPVTSCRSWDGAMATSSSLVETALRISSGAHRPTGGNHWSERASALLGPLLHAAAIEGLAMGDVLAWIDRHEPGPALEILDGRGDSVAGNLLAGIAATDSREQSGIWSTASGALVAYRSERALASTIDPNFDAAAFVERTATLYICASAHRQHAVAPLVAGVITEVRDAVYARAASEEIRGTPRQMGAPPVLLALDEVANIAPLPDLPSMLSEGGGQGLLVLACLQDLSQARTRWGPAADGFLSLFGTTVVLPGIGDIHTLRTISELAGEREELDRSVSSTLPTARTVPRAVARRLLLGPSAIDERSRRPPSVTWRKSARRRLPIDDAAHGRPGRALVIDRRKQMHWVELTPWFATEPWQHVLSQEPARVAPDIEPLPARPVQGTEPPISSIQPGSRAQGGPGSFGLEGDVGPDFGGPMGC